MSKSKNNSIKLTNIKEEKSIDGFATNSLQFTLTNVDHRFSNTIIRTCISLVGAYAFAQDDIEFTSNTSIFNRNYMKRRISNTPIVTHIKPDKDFAQKCVDLESEYLQKVDENLTDIELIEKKAKKKLEQIDNIHMNVDFKNDTNAVMHITSASPYTTFYKEQKIVPDIYPREIEIVDLKPGQEIKFSATSSFNIPMVNNIFSSTCIATHRYLTNNSYIFMIESFRQLTEREIVIQACKIIMIKLDNFKNKILHIIKSRTDRPNIEYKEEIEIPYETSTMGEIVAERLAHHEYVSNIKMKIEHPDNNAIILGYTVEGMKMSTVIEQVIKELIDDYQTVIDYLT